MAITLPDAHLQSDEVLRALRLRALRGRKLGFPQADLAELRAWPRGRVPLVGRLLRRRHRCPPRPALLPPPGSGRLLDQGRLHGR